MRMRVLVALGALSVACAGGCAKRMPLPRHLAVGDVTELDGRVRRARSDLVSFSADMRITYFGADGRVRATGALVVMRPASMRYELSGPHGGVVSAFATNGLELQALDVASSRFLYGRATATSLDRLLPFAPLGLGPDAWVRLLFGEVDLPPGATLAYDDRAGRFVVGWSEGGVERVVEIDPRSSRVTRARAIEGGILVSDVVIEERSDRGIPTSLHLRMPQAKVELEMKLRDLESNPDLDPSVFVLDPPSGIIPEHL